MTPEQDRQPVPDQEEESARDTKSIILDAAEELFGNQGYAATSLRAVTRLADVNLAAVHYHFGSKLGLFESVFRRRVTVINDERLALLSELESNAREPLTVEQLLNAFLGPALLRPTTEDPTWPRFQLFLGRVMSEKGEHVEAIPNVFRAVQMRFFPAFCAALPHLEERDVYWRVHLTVGAMCNILSDPARISIFSGGRCDGANLGETLRHMIAFCAGGMRAASTSKPGSEDRTAEEKTP